MHSFRIIFESTSDVLGIDIILYKLSSTVLLSFDSELSNFPEFKHL